MLLGRTPEEEISREDNPIEAVEPCGSVEDLTPDDRTILEDTTDDSAPEEIDTAVVVLIRLD